MKTHRPGAIRRCDKVAGGWGLFPEQPQNERAAHETHAGDGRAVRLSFSKMDINSL